MAANQNLRSGSTPKTDTRSRPPIQTSRSRPIQTSRSRPIQTYDPFGSRPLCFMLVGHFLLQSTEKYYSVLQSAAPVLRCTAKYWKVLLCTTKFFSVLQSAVGDFVNFEKTWPSLSKPRSRPFQTRSRPVPWNPRAVSIHSHVAQEEKQVCASSAESFDSV